MKTQLNTKTETNHSLEPANLQSIINSRVNEAFSKIGKSWIFELLNFFSFGYYSLFTERKIRNSVIDLLKVKYVLALPLTKSESTDLTIHKTAHTVLFENTSWKEEHVSRLRNFIIENNLDKEKLAKMSFSQISKHCTALSKILNKTEYSGFNKILDPLFSATPEKLKEISNYLNGQSPQISKNIKPLLDAAVQFAYLHKTNLNFRKTLKEIDVPKKKLNRFLNSLKSQSDLKIGRHLTSLILQSSLNSLSDKEITQMLKNVADSSMETVDNYLKLADLDELDLATQFYNSLTKQPKLKNSNANAFKPETLNIATTRDALRKGIHPAFDRDEGRNQGRIFSATIGNKVEETIFDSENTKEMIRKLSQKFKNTRKAQLLIQELLVQNFFSILPNQVMAGATLLCPHLMIEPVSTHFNATLKQQNSQTSLAMEYKFKLRLKSDLNVRENIRPSIDCSVIAEICEDVVGSLTLKADFFNQIRDSLTALLLQQG